MSGDTAYNNPPAFVGVPVHFIAMPRASTFQRSCRAETGRRQVDIRVFPIFHRCFCIFQGNRTVPTFRLDGGTVPRQKNLWRFQKPYILRGCRGANRPKKGTVRIDGPKYAFLHNLGVVFRLFSRNQAMRANLPHKNVVATSEVTGDIMRSSSLKPAVAVRVGCCSLTNALNIF